MLNSTILGAVAMASAVATLFFLRFWRQTHDRLFLFFAIAFAIDAVTRSMLGAVNVSNEQEPFFYLTRFLTFSLILIGIIDKNRW
jgi:hypothetical protein